MASQPPAGLVHPDDRIQIPPELPAILKQYTKAAIRTQPDDLLKWSARYFRALANKEPPPVKERLEFYGPAPGGLSYAVVKMMHAQLKDSETIKIAELEHKWRDFCLDPHLLTTVFKQGGISEDPEEEVHWLKFLSLLAGILGKDMKDRMKRICEILDPGSAQIPFSTFKELYSYLAQCNEVPASVIQNALDYLSAQAEKQNSMIQPVNFQGSGCPPLEAPT